MYQVLYRKWRPRRFSDVVGQPQATITLANEIVSGKISHAYLFTGTRGTGKTTCARILAKALCCEHPVNGDPCNECPNCRAIDEGSLMDVVEIDAASNRSIEDIKTLKEKSSFLPTVARYRIYIIDEVHMLSVDAFNALLKLIEEPPEHLIFIFATTEIHKVLPTIQSRCQKFNFRRIDSEDIAGRLEYISGEEGRELTHAAALMIARICDGAMRDSLSLLDRCFVYDGEITEETVTKAAGIMGRDRLFEISDAILNRDSVSILRVLDGLHRESCDSERVCSELIEHYRNFMLVLSLKNPEEAVICTPDDMLKYKTQASSLSVADTLRYIDVLCRTLERLKYSKTGRVELETALIRLCMPETDDDQEALTARISSLEKRISGIESGTVRIIQQPASPVVEDNHRPQSNAQKNDTTVKEIIDSSDKHADTDVPAVFEEDDIPPFGDTFSDDIPPEEEYYDDPTMEQDFPVFDGFADDGFDDDEPIQPGDFPFGAEDGSVSPFADAPEIGTPETTAETQPVTNSKETIAKWDAVCAEAKFLSPPLHGALNGSSASLSGDTVIVSLANPHLKRMINNANYLNIIAVAAEKVLGRKFRVKIL